jgi:CHAT domain-containing protein
VCQADAEETPRAQSPHPPKLVTSGFRLNGRYPAPTATAEEELEQAFALRKRLTQRDLQTAIRLFAESARRFSISGLFQKAAFAEVEAGDTYQMMSGYQQAINAYRRSLALSVDQPEPRCAALARMARSYANIGRVHNAAQYSDKAVALCETIPDKKALADALEAQGETRFWSTLMTDAMTSLTRARQLASEAKDRDGEALSTMMLALTINISGSDREQSNLLAWTALDLWVGTGNEYGAARAHMLLAFFAGGEGNFSLAQCHCERALPVFQRIADKDNAAVTLNILGMVARESGDVEASLDSYRRARDDFAAAQDDLGEAESITGMAAVLTSQHNYSGVLPLYVRKLHLAQRTGHRALLASALVDMAGVYLHQHRYLQAEANYQRGLAEYRAAGNRSGESVALMRLAGLRTEQGRLRQALVLLHQAGELREQTGEIEDLARIHYSRARLYKRLNLLEEARSEIEKTIEIIESQRLRIAKFDTRAQYFASVHQYYSLYIQVLMALDELHPDQRYNQLAFEAAEKSKVRALLDLLENTQRTPSCDELLARNSNSRFAQTNELPAGTPDAVPAQALTLAEIQEEIGDGETVLLEYALGDDRSFAWLVDGGQISAFNLGPAAAIRTSARAFREALMPLHPREYETSIDYLQRRRTAKNTLVFQSKQLTRLLLGPLELPARKRVLIVPDGPLQYVPFSALPVPGRVETPLVALHELTMLPSASVLAALRKTAATKPPPVDGVAIFADPVFEKSETTASTNTAIGAASERSHDLQRALQDSRGSQHIPRLPGSRSEALVIQQIVGPAHTRLALGFDANRESVIDGSLARQRVIHFATHGIVDTRHPEMSGLILSLLNQHGEYQDGYLRLSDIYNLKLSADLVVLSSCESALGKDLESEGIIGLPRGFLYAGARSVIASLWKVDDDATAILMKALYSRMQRGESPNNALHGAQLDLLKDARFSEPYYWAAFVLEGDYN